MTPEFLITVLAASLLGSTHCSGMCGPFVILVAGAAPQRSDFAWRLGAYHLGRLFTYLILGTLAGLFGATLNTTGNLLGWQRTAALLAGSTMFLVALVILLRQLGWRIQHLPLPAKWVSLIHSCFRRVARWPAIPRAWAIGAFTTWLPCGWLYAFVLVAAGAGAVLPALLIMVAFWIGTLPLLSLLGWSSANLAPRLRQALPWVSFAACLILGFFTLLFRSAVSLDSLDSQLAETNTLQQRLDHATNAKLPCCHDD